MRDPRTATVQRITSTKALCLMSSERNRMYSGMVLGVPRICMLFISPLFAVGSELVDRRLVKAN